MRLARCFTPAAMRLHSSSLSSIGSGLIGQLRSFSSP